MTDENFGLLIAFTDIEQKVLDHYRTWIHTWLCARERKVGLPINTIARPRSYIIKQTFAALPGEEQTPAVIAVSDGFASEPERRGNGAWDARFRLGIAALCYGGPENAARKMCGHYQTALVGIATHHRGIDNGSIKLDDFVNLRIEDIDEEALGRSMASVRMEIIYKVESFASEEPMPLEPTEVPLPTDPEVHTVKIDVENYRVNEEIPQ